MGIRKVSGRYKAEYFEGDKVSGHCPSVDILFESVANEAGKDRTGQFHRTVHGFFERDFGLFNSVT